MAKKPAKTTKTEPKPVVYKVALVNRKNHPVTLMYDGAQFIIPPKGRTKKEFIESKLSGVNPVNVTILR